MSKKYNLISTETYDTITGPISYNLTNDYMFKATLQESQEVLPGLIGALLHVDPKKITTEVTNPIELGKSIAGKDFYLDVKVSVNNQETVNLEMQVENLGNWIDRSTSYSARLYDNLNVGDDYDNVTPVHHIGFVSFNPFKENNKFFDTFMLRNTDNSLIYTDKFKISVVNLNKIDLANDLDKKYMLDKWVRLIIAETWEDLRELAKEDSYMEATARKLFELSSDFDIQEEARRRKHYFNYLAKIEKKNKEQAKMLAEKDASLAEMKELINRLQAELAGKNN